MDDLSSVSQSLNASQLKSDVKPPIELIEHKDKQKQLRNETKYFGEGNQFKQEVDETVLLKLLLELVSKSKSLLDMSSAEKQVAQTEDLRILEMSLNKNDVLSKWVSVFTLVVDKSKLVVLKLMRLYIVIPFTLAKIEVRVRNVMLN